MSTYIASYINQDLPFFNEVLFIVSLYNYPHFALYMVFVNIVYSLQLFLFTVNRNVVITKVELQLMEYGILLIHRKIN